MALLQRFSLEIKPWRLICSPIQVNHSEWSGKRYYTITLLTSQISCFSYTKVNLLKWKAIAKTHCDNNSGLTTIQKKKEANLQNGSSTNWQLNLQSHTTRDTCQTLSQLRSWWPKWNRSEAAAYIDPLWNDMMCWDNSAWCRNIWHQ